MPHDGQQMKMMLDQSDLQDRALTRLFSGTTVCDTTEYVFYIHPSDNVTNQPLFRFSRHFGMVDADDLSGEPYVITITDLNSVPTPMLRREEEKDRRERALLQRPGTPALGHHPRTDHRQPGGDARRPVR